MIQNVERTKDGMDSLIDRTRDAVVGAADRAERGVEAAAERVVETAHVAGEHVRDGAAIASNDAHRRVDGAARAVDRGYSRARSELSYATAGARDYVVEHPRKALLVAGAAGFALGLLTHRRFATA